jgi:hypothetical protein
MSKMKIELQEQSTMKSLQNKNKKDVFIYIIKKGGGHKSAI